MELFVHKFNPEAPEQTGEWVYDMIAKIEDALLNKPEGSYGEQFWHKGHVDVLGYRFYPDNTEHVLVESVVEAGKVIAEEADNRRLSAVSKVRYEILDSDIRLSCNREILLCFRIYTGI